jgi:hypothetical protein
LFDVQKNIPTFAERNILGALCANAGNAKRFGF